MSIDIHIRFILFAGVGNNRIFLFQLIDFFILATQLLDFSIFPNELPELSGKSLTFFKF